jgi:molybdenum cofactor cytidylyltransferase
MTRAIVLAAGASTRMGQPKALLQAGGRTFIRTILDVLREAGLPGAVVVVRPTHDEVIAEVAASGFGRTVVNPRADEGQLSSLIAGLDAIDEPEVDAALVTLVDVPLISVSAIRRLLARTAISSAPILRAVHHGAHGHPVVFKREIFAALRAADPAEGAKAVVRSIAVEDVETGDPGVLEDVDTPEDYERLIGKRRAADNRRPPNP